MAAGALCRRERRIDAAAGVGSRSSERAGESSRLGLPEAEAEAPRRRKHPDGVSHGSIKKSAFGTTLSRSR